jgi:hypothetical protein
MCGTVHHGRASTVGDSRNITSEASSVYERPLQAVTFPQCLDLGMVVLDRRPKGSGLEIASAPCGSRTAERIDRRRRRLPPSRVRLPHGKRELPPREAPTDVTLVLPAAGNHTDVFANRFNLAERTEEGKVMYRRAFVGACLTLVALVAIGMPVAASSTTSAGNTTRAAAAAIRVKATIPVGNHPEAVAANPPHQHHLRGQ